MNFKPAVITMAYFLRNKKKFLIPFFIFSGIILFFSVGVSSAQAFNPNVGVPSSPSPYNNQTDAPLPITLRWNSISSPPSAPGVLIGYFIEGSSTIFPSGKEWVTQPQYYVSGSGGGVVPIDTSYQWRVRACLGTAKPANPTVEENNCGNWSSFWQFSPTLANPLADPQNALPSNGGTISPDNNGAITLIWNNVLGADSYKILFDKVGDLSYGIKTFDNISSNDYIVPAALLTLNYSYKWKVVGKKANKEGLWSPEWQFNFVLAQVAPVAPLNGARVTYPLAELEWNVTSGQPDEFFVEIFNSTGKIKDANVTATSLADPLKGIVLIGQTYTWRVTPYKNGTPGPTTGLWSFTLIYDKPTGLKPSSASAPTVLPVSSLGWTAPPIPPPPPIFFVPTYYWQVDGRESGNTGNTGNTTVGLKNYISAAGTYTWRVKACDDKMLGCSADAISTFEIKHTFVIDPAPMSAWVGKTIQFKGWYDLDGAGSAVQKDMASDFGTIWSSSNSKITISKGLATCPATADSTQITATYKGLTATAYLTCYDPKPISPVNNVTGVPLNPVLSWQGSVPSAPPGASSYFVVNYKKWADPLSLWMEVKPFSAANSVQISGLINNILYRWLVKICVKTDKETCSDWSDNFTFTTIPSVPIGLSPAGTGIPLSPTLRWNRAGGADHYLVSLGSFSPMETREIFADFSSNYPLQANTTYSWSVKACDVDSKCSETGNATFTTLPPPTISFFTPFPNNITAGGSVTLNWETADAKFVTIKGTGLTEEGRNSSGLVSFPLTNAGNYSYTLTAVGDGGQVSSAPITVTVTPKPSPTPSPAPTPPPGAPGPAQPACKKACPDPPTPGVTCIENPLCAKDFEDIIDNIISFI
ncbi:MAG: hypothetical protein Q7K28_02425, partial [Candidatus Wildermuthbacteria bacterium]|nr:hypothetical protein [Candidatus Wildermuthbacteria bacterium]